MGSKRRKIEHRISTGKYPRDGGSGFISDEKRVLGGVFFGAKLETDDYDTGDEQKMDQALLCM